MATYLENLRTARTNIGELLVKMTANPKPSYSVDGQSISWESYLDMLNRQLEALDKSIQRAQAPFSKLTRGRA